MSDQDNQTIYKRRVFSPKISIRIRNPTIEFEKAMSNSDGNLSDSNDLMLMNQTEAQQNFVTYVIGIGEEILIHRFQLDLEEGQDVDAVVKNLDDQMEAMHGKICFRMD